jgi:hypothetical protein
MQLWWVASTPMLVLVGGTQHTAAWDDAWAACQAEAIEQMEVADPDADQRSEWQGNYVAECIPRLSRHTSKLSSRASLSMIPEVFVQKLSTGAGASDPAGLSKPVLARQRRAGHIRIPMRRPVHSASADERTICGSARDYHQSQILQHANRTAYRRNRGPYDRSRGAVAGPAGKRAGRSH